MAYLHEQAISGQDHKDIPMTHDSGVIGLHIENLFDQDERQGDGARINEADGMPYDNSTVTDEKIIAESLGRIIDVSRLSPQHTPNDAAEQWLRENDPTHPEYQGRLSNN